MLGSLFRAKEKGRALAKRFGIPAVYTDMEAFLNAPDIDIIYIASPNSLHYSQAKMALEHGKHVIVEKPMTPYYGQTKELFDLALKKGLLCFEASTIGHAPNFAIMKEHLDEIGRTRLVLCSYSQYSSRYDLLRKDEVTNMFDPAFCAEPSWILIITIYIPLPPFLAVRARLFIIPTGIKNGIDTSGILMMIYPDFVCQCTGAKDTWGANGVQIQGEDGYIFVAGSTNESGPVKVVTKVSEKIYDVQPDGNQWYYEFQSLDRSFMMAIWSGAKH